MYVNKKKSVLLEKSKLPTVNHVKRNFDNVTSESLTMVSNSSRSASSQSFLEEHFRLPPLESGLDEWLGNRDSQNAFLKKQIALRRDISKEMSTLKHPDELMSEDFIKMKEVPNYLKSPILRKKRIEEISDAELKLIKYVIEKKSGEFRDQLKSIPEQLWKTLEIEGVNIENFSVSSRIPHSTSASSDSISNETYLKEMELEKKPASIREKMEDLRSEGIEQWIKKHGKILKQKFTNFDKRQLRKWFNDMDYDGSGEVQVDELQDPLLSAGILKTREQGFHFFYYFIIHLFISKSY